MIIGIAQIRPIKGDIAANIDKHRQFIEEASTLKASALFFPELSLTGYEPELAKDLATTQDDIRLDKFQELSDTKSITIGLGIPTRSDSGIRISMIIFQPGRARRTYSKQQLHQDEHPYFESGSEDVDIIVDGLKIAPAICYESLQPVHADNASKRGADIYLASVAKSQDGITKAMAHFPAIAKKYGIPVLMSNCVGHCDNFLSAGQSSVWAKNGHLAGQLYDNSEGILVFDMGTEEVGGIGVRILVKYKGN